MFGTRTVRQAIWKSGKKKVSGCWEYSNIFDRYDIWLDMKDPLTGSRVHYIVPGSKGSPEWGNWKLINTKEPNGNQDRTDAN